MKIGRHCASRGQSYVFIRDRLAASWLASQSYPWCQAGSSHAQEIYKSGRGRTQESKTAPRGLGEPQFPKPAFHGGPDARQSSSPQRPRVRRLSFASRSLARRGSALIACPSRPCSSQYPDRGLFRACRCFCSGARRFGNPVYISIQTRSSQGRSAGRNAWLQSVRHTVRHLGACLVDLLLTCGHCVS